jgi:hypothetical protein
LEKTNPLRAFPEGIVLLQPEVSILSILESSESNPILSITTQVEEDASTVSRCMQARKTAGVGAVLLEPKFKVAPENVFYALRSRDGTCASGCGVSQTCVAEIVFGIEIVEWDLCSACLSRTGFLEYFKSLPSATPREAEEIKILLGISFS